MKKRMVLWTALVLCVGLLCGCWDGSPASRTESTPAETSLPESQASLAGKDSSQDGEKSGPVESPPYLRVSSGDSGVQATRSTYSWILTHEDGTGVGTNANGIAPEDMGNGCPGWKAPEQQSFSGMGPRRTTCPWTAFPQASWQTTPPANL